MTPSIAALLVLLATASAIDLRSRRIPNLLNGLGLLLAFALASAEAGSPGTWTALQGAGLGLAIFLPMFVLRAVGAGDVKLMTVVGALVGPGELVPLTVASFAASGTIALSVGIATGRVGELLAGLRTTVYALASRDVKSASAIAQQTQYRVPFALAALIGAIAWHLLLRA
jgi:prepilin peptidase CpaA